MELVWNRWKGLDWDAVRNVFLQYEQTTRVSSGRSGFIPRAIHA
jgi:hypothetical protein